MAESVHVRSVSMWDADQGTGSPICVSAEGNFSINLYENEGAVIGLCVYDGDGELLGAYGDLPIEVIQEERRYLGLEPLSFPDFLSVSALGEVVE